MTEAIEKCPGVGSIVYEKDGVQREWCVGAMYGGDTVDTLRAHLEKWIPGARLLSADIRPVDANTDAYTSELAGLKEENERLREATRRLLKLALLVGYTEDGRYNKRGGALIHQGQIRECFEAIEAAQAALDQEEDKIAQCQKRAIELVYRGECDNMTRAEVRQMLVDEFGEAVVATLAMTELEE